MPKTTVFDQEINELYLASRAKSGIPSVLTDDERLWLSPLLVCVLRKRRATADRRLTGKTSLGKQKAA